MAIGDYYNLCVKFDRNGNPLPYSQKITVGTDSNGTAILATTGVTLAQRHDANTTIAVANGDFAQLQLDSTGRLKVDIGSSVTLTSGLPTGASTSILQTTGNTSLVSIDSKLTSPLTVSGTVIANAGTNLNTSLLTLESGGNLASINTKIPSNLTVTATRLLVDGSGATQPISAASLPLPTGAATSANQTTANTSLNSIDTKLPTAATLADGTTNPSTSTFGSDLSNFNGTTWDRARNIIGATNDTGVLATAEYISTSSNVTASFASSTALSPSIIAKTSSGNLYELTGYSTTAGFIQIFNSTTVPADGAIPTISFAIEANNNFSRTLPKPIRFSTGIVACFSTTQATKTIGGSVVWFEIIFK